VSGLILGNDIHMPPKISPWAFVLAVSDLERSAAYYRDILGFQVRWQEASDWRLIERYLEVDDVDALYAEITARGAACSAPRQAHYGMREIVVTTIDGHRIVFGQGPR
jgi:catechol 2,3-dioxygenase-like lactoylglutathione lyase family enzyme